MSIIRIDARRLTDATALHSVLSETFGFPATYGKNMVEINLVHPNIGDLSIVLVTPHFDEYQLKWSSTVTGGADFIRTVFADAATDSLANGTAPYRGDFKPADGLIGQRNIPKMGTWRLYVEDKVSQAPGSLLSWALYIKP